MSEPRCIEVEISATSGGRVQIVQFKLSNEFEVGYSEKYTIPAEWTQERFDEWKEKKMHDIKQKADVFAQVEQDSLLESSDWYRK